MVSNKFIENLHVKNFLKDHKVGYDLSLFYDFRILYFQKEIPFYFPIDASEELFRYSADFYGIVYNDIFEIIVCD